MKFKIILNIRKLTVFHIFDTSSVSFIVVSIIRRDTRFSTSTLFKQNVWHISCVNDCFISVRYLLTIPVSNTCVSLQKNRLYLKIQHTQDFDDFSSKYISRSSTLYTALTCHKPDIYLITFF